MEYLVDPAVDDITRFYEYMSKKKISIDVWDGDSLMMIGSASCELKHILRQGKSAVQELLSLDLCYFDVFSSLYSSIPLKLQLEKRHGKH